MCKTSQISVYKLFLILDVITLTQNSTNLLQKIENENSTSFIKEKK